MLTRVCGALFMFAVVSVLAPVLVEAGSVGQRTDEVARVDSTTPSGKGRPRAKKPPVTRIVKIPRTVGPIETEKSAPSVTRALPSSLPGMPSPAADAEGRGAGGNGPVVPPVVSELVPEKAEHDSPKSTGKTAVRETVPGEALEGLSEETHPKQEHVLKSLPPKGGYTVIPLPAFSYTRNESYWAGALMPILRANEKEELEDIFAPLYLHNKFIGETFSLNYYGYRNETVQYHAIAAYATKIERHFELSYKDVGAGGGRYILAAEANWFKNAFVRFFGIGNRTAEENETNFTARETNVKLSAGINLGQNMSILWTERFRDVRVEDGVIETLPQAKLRFPNIEGVAGAQIFGHRATFLYDTRDNLLTPVKGAYVAHYWELGHNLIHNEPDRWVRVALDARYLFPHASNSMVFVSRLLIDKVFSRGVPFYERPMLGGENTLRGFGLNRFIDDNLFLVNLEERVRVLQKRVFDNPLEFELAPFLDMGRVNRDFVSRLSRTQFNPGVGVRVLSRPNVVGRLDVAYGKDGENVFVGLDYPF